jgi:hypothetical protein
MKLSEKQKEVITLMRGKRELCYNRYIGYSAVSFSNPTLFVNKNTWHSLKNKGLIELNEHKGHSSHNYRLTELGKTIQL